MDSAQIYSSTLEQLNKTVVRLTSPEWDAKVQGAPPEQRQNALAELLRVQHAWRVLANAALQEIAEQLKANEQNMLDGQKALQAELDKLATVEAVLKAISSFVNVVGAGFGAAVAAIDQAGKGKTVFILERGVWWLTPELSVENPMNPFLKTQPVQYWPRPDHRRGLVDFLAVVKANGVAGERRRRRLTDLLQRDDRAVLRHDE